MADSSCYVYHKVLEYETDLHSSSLLSIHRKKSQLCSFSGMWHMLLNVICSHQIHIIATFWLSGISCKEKADSPAL